jgi:hypothetical protein
MSAANAFSGATRPRRLRTVRRPTHWPATQAALRTPRHKRNGLRRSTAPERGRAPRVIVNNSGARFAHAALTIPTTGAALWAATLARWPVLRGQHSGEAAAFRLGTSCGHPRHSGRRRQPSPQADPQSGGHTGPQQGPPQPTTAGILESYRPPVTCSFTYFRCRSIVVFGLSGGGGVGSNPTGGTREPSAQQHSRFRAPEPGSSGAAERAASMASATHAREHQGRDRPDVPIGGRLLI